MSKYLVVGFGGAGKRALKCMSEIDPLGEFAIWTTGARNDDLPPGVGRISNVTEALNYNADGVFISTPTSKHIEYAEHFLNRAKWIVIDKPLDDKLNKCEVFARNAKYSSTKVYINFQRRYMQCWSKVNKLILSKKTGKFLNGLVKIASFYPDWRPNKNVEEIYVSRRDLGGGVLLTECHEIDLIQWLLGPIISVDARCVDKMGENNVEDQAQLLLEVQLEDGNKSIVVDLNDKVRPTERYMRLSFENMTIVIEEDSNKITVYDTDGSNKYVECFETENPHKSLLADVIADKGNPPMLRDGLLVNAVIEAAKKSSISKKGQIVNESVCPYEGTKYLNAAIDLLIEEFGNRVIAVYGLGSLGYGGYVEGWSDFDIDVIVHTDYEQARDDYRAGKAIEKKVKESGFDRIDIRVYDYQHLNVRKTILEYGQCSRATMLCDSAVLLMGKDIRKELIRPTLEEQNREGLYLLEHMLDFGDQWWNNLPWDDIAAHFALTSRFLYTKDTGRVAGKQMALEYALNTYADKFDNEQLQWLLWALSMRTNYHPMMIQDVLHNTAVSVLKRTFVLTRNILAEVVS